MRTSLLLLSLISSLALAGTPVVMEKAGDLVTKYGEKTCEGTYYGLFAPAEDPKAPDLKKDFDQAKKVYEDIKAVIPKSAAFSKIKETHPHLAEEWLLRLKRSRFIESESEGAFARFVDGDGKDLEAKDLLGDRMKSVLDGDRLTEVPTVLWKGGRSTPSNEAGKAFFLGHEATHLLNWAPAEIVKCLAEEKGYAARRRVDTTEHTPAQKAFTLLLNQRNNTVTLDLKTKEKVEADATRALALVKTCTPPSGGFDRMRDFRFERGLYELEGFSPERRRLLDEIMRDLDRKGLLDELKKEMKKKEEKQEPKMDQRSGWGTTPFVLFESCLKKDAAAAVELFGLLKRYRVAGLPGERFEDQMIEAVADYYGVEFVVEWIKTHVLPADRRGAALQVLRAMAPVFYPTDAREILDYVSSKKTNEARVLGLLLAHPEFRKLLGCELKAPGPRYCGA